MAMKPFEFKNAKPSSTVRKSKQPGVEMKDGTEPDASAPDGDPVKAALNAILAAKTPEEMKAHAQEALAAYSNEESDEGESDGE